MVNNLARLILVGIVACSTSACGPARATEQAPFQGVVELDTVVLAFEVAGRVERVAVKEGDHVEGNSTLAQLDETLTRPERDSRAADLEAARAQLALLEAGARSEDVRAAEADLASVEQQLAVLTRQRQRQQQLTQSGAAPSSVLDELDTQMSALQGRRNIVQQQLRALRLGARKQEVEVARAKVRALEAALVAVDARLSRFKLTYEGSADVLEVHAKVGEVVAPGTPALTVADLDHPYVDIFVPQAQIAALKVGTEMLVRIDSLREPLRGRVERVGYRTEFTPRYLFSEKERANLVIRVRVRIQDAQHLMRAGVPAFVAISAREG